MEVVISATRLFVVSLVLVSFFVCWSSPLMGLCGHDLLLQYVELSGLPSYGLVLSINYNVVLIKLYFLIENVS
jgi:hypothetical protein